MVSGTFSLLSVFFFAQITPGDLKLIITRRKYRKIQCGSVTSPSQYRPAAAQADVQRLSLKFSSEGRNYVDDKGEVGKVHHPAT